MNQILPLNAALSGGPTLLLRPLVASALGRSHVLELPALELVQLAAGQDAARRFSTSRGYLHDTPQTLALERLARESPEHFGLIDWITLGADAIRQAGADGYFTRRYWVHGAEIIDGHQRLRAAAAVLDELGPEHLAKMILKVEVFCGDERDQARMLHGRADQYLNVRTAQDRLMHCPHIRRLEEANWERMSFDWRRGITGGPAGAGLSMVEVTRALACLSRPGPDLAHQASTAEGLTRLWDDIRSPSYLSLFHARMTPLGVMRAIEARRAAQDALDDLPKSRQKGHGLLIKYAPELIHWAACRVLPLNRLHDESFRYDWNAAVRVRIKENIEATVNRLIHTYEELVPATGAKGNYSTTAPELSVWQALSEGF